MDPITLILIALAVVFLVIVGIVIPREPFCHPASRGQSIPWIGLTVRSRRISVWLFK